MTPLKVELKRNGAKVYVKVLSQDESTREKDEIFRSSEGFRLVSIALPAIHSKFANTLYVRGSCKENDNLWSDAKVARSPQVAAEYIEKAKRAIAEYNESIKAEREDNMGNKEEVKPCPFCGTPPSLEYEMVYPRDPHSRGFDVKWEVICPYCGTKKSGGMTQYVVGINENLVRCKDSADGRAQAIKLWNERTGE